MQCPNDGTTLMMTERHGVEIDYCPQCRGVWLDRGELDKIVAQADTGGNHPSHAVQPSQHHGGQTQNHHYSDDDDDDYHHERRHGSHGYDNQHGHHKKKESFLGDLFDF